MSLEERQARARRIIASLMEEEAAPAKGEWLWGLIAAGLAVVAVWLCRFW
jgi:hypothetical protein